MSTNQTTLLEKHNPSLPTRVLDRIFEVSATHRFGWVVGSRPANTTVTSAVNVPQSALREHHPLASISGMLETHPLRDEYLEALGITE